MTSWVAALALLATLGTAASGWAKWHSPDGIRAATGDSRIIAATPAVVSEASVRAQRARAIF